MRQNEHHPVITVSDRVSRLELPRRVKEILLVDGIGTVAELFDAARKDELVRFAGLSSDHIVSIEILITSLGFHAELPEHHFVQELGLSRRAERALIRNHIITVEHLMELDSSRLLALKGVGRKALEGIEARIREFNANPSSVHSSTLTRTHSGSEAAPSELLNFTFVTELGLSHRTAHVLFRNRIKTTEQLMAMDRAKLLPVMGLGPKALQEIEAGLAKLATTKPPRHVSAEEISLAQALLKQKWQNLCEIIRNEIKANILHGSARFEGRTLGHWLTQDHSLPEESLPRICDGLALAVKSKTIADELGQLLQGILDHDVEIFIDRLGPRGQTFVEIGRKMRLTRERIRQITNRVGSQITQGLSIHPCLRIQTALAIAEEMGLDITYSRWVRRITVSGLVGTWARETANGLPMRVSPIEMLLITCNSQGSRSLIFPYALPENLKLVIGHKNLSARAARVLETLPIQTMRSIRKQARNGGAVHVPPIANEFALTVKEARSVLSELGYRRISDDWYMLRPFRGSQTTDYHWAVFHTALKIVRICGPLGLEEIYAGLSRHGARRGHIVPPPPILAHVLATLGFEVQNERVSWQWQNPGEASPSEKIILGEMERLGPIVSHLELAHAFAQSGLSVPALAVTLTYSPLFTRVGFGLYTLRGRIVTQGDIETVRQRRPSPPPGPRFLENESAEQQGVLTDKQKLEKVRANSQEESDQDETGIQIGQR